MADIAQEDTYTGVVSPFFSENDPSSGSISYEIHQGGSSQTILSTVNQIVNQHTNASFNGSWVLVATWNNVQQNARSNVSFPRISKLYHVFPQTNTFQGILVTDLTTSSYAVFTYHCGDMSFSDPGLIGFTHIKDGVNITHGATYREHPYFVSCLNEQNSDWVNVVYEIAKSGKKLSIISCFYQAIYCHYKTEDECEADNGGCEQICTNTFLSFNCNCHGGYTLNDDGYTCSGK